MFKKAVPVVALSTFLLVGCNNNNDEAVPDTNETPMEDVERGADELVPDMNNDTNGTNGTNNGTNGTTGGTTGPNGMNGTGGTDGTINNQDEQGIGNNGNQDETVPGGTVNGPNTDAGQQIKEDIKETNEQ